MAYAVEKTLPVAHLDEKLSHHSTTAGIQTSNSQHSMTMSMKVP